MLSEKVIKAEVKIVKFFTLNNLSLAVADEPQYLMKDVDPDSNIIKDIKGGKSKSKALMRKMGDMTKEMLVVRMR